MSDPASENITRVGRPVQITLEIPNPRLALVGIVAVIALAGAVLGGLHLTAAPAAHTGASQPLPTAPPDIQPAGWTQTFADTFDGATRDDRLWMDAYPGGLRTHGNNEQQFYAPHAVTLSNGHLRLTADRNVSGAGMPYTSGMITSYGRFAQRYGWFEMRARLPAGRGLWPAFWLLPENRSWPPEVDILEAVGQEPSFLLFTHHWGDTPAHHEWRAEKLTGPDLSADFHVFALNWEPDRLVWYVDGVERHRVTDHVPQTPMFVLANLAVGGDLPGSPDATTAFPATLEVDYIRVFRKTKGVAPTLLP